MTSPRGVAMQKVNLLEKFGKFDGAIQPKIAAS